MLQTLKIKNVALIEEVTIDFDRKLNVISGETGAGKSIMLDSLSFVFGGRADRTLIRTGSTSMKVEAVFTCLSDRQIELIKNESDISCDDELFVSRELDVNGKNICKINGELVPVNTVKKICLALIDVHGQSEHLAILDNDYQLKIIDLFSKSTEPYLSKLAEAIEEYKQNEKEIKSLGGSEEEKQNLIDLYTYQINEIDNAKIEENEFESLQIEKKEMQQFEKINSALSSVCDILSNSFGDGVTDKMSTIKHVLMNISELSPKYEELYSRIDSALIELNDIANTSKECLEANVFDEARFNFVDERIDFLKSLFRKYKADSESLLEYRREIGLKLENIINSSEKYQELLLKKEKILKNINNIQIKLSEIRKNSAKTLKDKLEKELKTLGMPNARIDIAFERIQEEFSLFGFDKVEFMFSSNLGFELKPLNKVVSGGEMSRVMLAYKIVVSEIDMISTIIFDEIDTGLSGNIATVVGEYMARLSLNKQIIAVSHLPQICAMADKNIKVEKYSDKVTTHTKANELNEQDAILEIARLMGAEINDVGLSASKDLKYKSNEYKKSLLNDK